MDNFTLEKEAYDLKLGLLTSAIVRVLETRAFERNGIILKNAFEFLAKMLDGSEYMEGTTTELMSSGVDDMAIYSFLLENYSSICDGELNLDEIIRKLTESQNTIRVAMEDPTNLSSNEIESTKTLFLKMSEVLTKKNRKNYGEPDLVF